MGARGVICVLGCAPVQAVKLSSDFLQNFPVLLWYSVNTDNSSWLPRGGGKMKSRQKMTAAILGIAAFGLSAIATAAKPDKPQGNSYNFV